jgi:urease alpha subunit
VPRNVTLTGLRISVTTAATGTASIGIYSNTQISGNDIPNALLTSVTGLSTGATGDVTGTLSYTLQVGTLYWACLIASAAATVRAMAVGSIQTALGRTVNNTTVISYFYAGGSGSTLPSSATALTFTYGTGSAPAIYLLE